MDVLALRDNMMHELQQIKEIEVGIDYLNKVKGVEAWAKAEKKDAELQNKIAEQKIRTQRILGQLIQDGQRKGEIAKQKDNQHVPKGDKLKTLSDIGITRKESSVFQAIANIPDDVFEDAINAKNDCEGKTESELTTTSMVKVAHNYKKHQRASEMKNVVIEVTTKKYRVVYADPPWKYNEVNHQTEGNFQSKTLGNHYLFKYSGIIGTAN